MLPGVKLFAILERNALNDKSYGRQNDSHDFRNVHSDLVLPITPSSNDEGTSASGILEEEVDKDCHVCRLRIAEQGNRCDLCQFECHDQCMQQNDDDGGTCLSCAATQNQIEMNSVMSSDQSTASGPDQKDIHFVRTVNVVNVDDLNAGTSEANQEVDAAVPAISGSSKTGMGTSTGQRNFVRVKDKVKSTDSTAIKQRELRQREAKIKKREEELDMQEAKSSTRGDASRRLEEYLQKTEARNVELEATIRTLQRKICLLEKESPTEVLNSGPPGVNVASDSQRNGPGGHFDHSQTNMSGRFEDPMTKMNCELMKGIHRQVTSFVLTKVAQQLSCLESYTGMMQNQQQFTGHNMNVHNPNTDAMNTATPLLNPIFNPSFNQTLYRQANPTLLQILTNNM
ncbi:MAG: hypothetical protein N0C90_11605 [Candidatus Thiodiazotropha endolucinida]|nr:hypothetical protein [Candidatus Thiodiazotropha taylori]MCW4262005.1 hypothetical protein [Candidatus Thiodiazotropha endolucinida]